MNSEPKGATASSAMPQSMKPAETASQSGVLTIAGGVGAGSQVHAGQVIEQARSWTVEEVQSRFEVNVERHRPVGVHRGAGLLEAGAVGQGPPFLPGN